MLSRSAVRFAVGVAFVLSLPLVAMLFTDEVAWTLQDFVAAGVLLTTIGVAAEVTPRRAAISRSRSALPLSASRRRFSERPMTRPGSYCSASC